MDSHDLESWRDLIARGRKIEAIKEIRTATGLGLKEAKDLSELIERGGGLFEVSAALGGASPSTTPPPPPPTSSADEIDRLVSEGRLIEAIKRYREKTGLGLRESKDAIDAMVAAKKNEARRAR